MTHLFTNSVIEPPDVKRPGYVDFSDALPLNEEVSASQAEAAVRRTLGIPQGDHAAVGAALSTLVVSGTLKRRGRGVHAKYKLVKKWGPNGSPAVEDAPEAAWRDTALERVAERDRQREDQRIRALVDERLREHGLIGR